MIPKLAFIDTETTGFNPEVNYVIEIGGIIEYGDTYEEFLLNSSVPEGTTLSEEAEEKHGYSLEDIMKFPGPADAYRSLIEIFEKHVDRYDRGDKFIFIGYSAEFDNNFLRSFFDRNNDQYFGSWFFTPWIDVMSLAANALKTERDRMENFKLGTVAKFIGLGVQEDQLHNSGYDIQLTRELYWKIEGKKVLDTVRTDEEIQVERERTRGVGFPRRQNG